MSGGVSINISVEELKRLRQEIYNKFGRGGETLVDQIMTRFNGSPKVIGSNSTIENSRNIQNITWEEARTNLREAADDAEAAYVERRRVQGQIDRYQQGSGGSDRDGIEQLNEDISQLRDRISQIDTWSPGSGASLDLYNSVLSLRNTEISRLKTKRDELLGDVEEEDLKARREYDRYIGALSDKRDERLRISDRDYDRRVRREDRETQLSTLTNLWNEIGVEGMPYISHILGGGGGGFSGGYVPSSSYNPTTRYRDRNTRYRSVDLILLHPHSVQIGGEIN